MYLKRIETVGFKSFADKINIEFNDGVNAVVGPNGSGKSNILDSIRWVLGEQSVKQLRGASSMTDIIFSGSSTRRPLNFASVTLVLDNGDNHMPIDYSEVSITRRVYRSGESEYLLNNEVCRLKDITDLIMDTGLGKESFSIISQGRVQEILGSKPEERRVIFEEAAGVSKYRKRKESAIKKLESTENNLTQVDNIIYELERQLDPLKKQSEQAKIYLEKRADLHKIEIGVIAKDIEELKETYDRSVLQIANLESQSLEISSSISISEAKVVENTNLIRSLDEEVQQLQDNLLKATSLVEKVSGQKQVLVERRKYAKDNMDRFVENAMKLRETELQLKNKINQIQTEILDKTELVTTTKEAIKNIEYEISSNKNKRLDIEQQQNNLIRERETSKSRLQSIINATETNANLLHGVRSVLNNKELNGIHDVIGNLITLDDQYTKAIETALGNAMQFIVCDTDENARGAVKYLKDEKLGRATFFPIETIKGRSIDEVYDLVKKHEAFIAPANTLVTCNNIYQDIINNQLGNVIVARDLVGANHISHMIDHKFKIVTLDGEVVHIGGSITGGSYNRNSSTILREKQEIEELKKLIQNNEQTYNENDELIIKINEEIARLESKVYTERVNLFQHEEFISNKVINLNSTKSSLDDCVRELNNLNNIINDTNEETEEMALLNELYEHEAMRDNLTREIANKRGLRLKYFENNNELEIEIRESNRLLRDYQNEMKREEVIKTRSDVEIETLLKRLSEEYNMTYEYAKNEFILSEDLEEARAKVKVLRDTIKALGYVNVSAIDEYEAVNERHTFLTKQKEDLIEAKKILLETIKEMDKVMVEKFSETFRKIQTEFNYVFRQLFIGGRAELRLTDPENILETGIEIIAQPPGKTLQHLSLFSGGEKALTAISLLFAIIRVRPVPFCVLDEVESALDEANVARYADYLSQHKNKTQFIVITHRKGTMEKADALYGVTMQESGVSKLVSVHLEDINQYMDEDEKVTQN